MVRGERTLSGKYSRGSGLESLVPAILLYVLSVSAPFGNPMQLIDRCAPRKTWSATTTKRNTSCRFPGHQWFSVVLFGDMRGLVMNTLQQRCTWQFEMLLNVTWPPDHLGNCSRESYCQSLSACPLCTTVTWPIELTQTEQHVHVSLCSAIDA